MNPHSTPTVEAAISAPTLNQLHLLADLLDSCEPEDDAPVTWGSLRRQVRKAADLDLTEGARMSGAPPGSSPEFKDFLAHRASVPVPPTRQETP